MFTKRAQEVLGMPMKELLTILLVLAFIIVLFLILRGGFAGVLR